MNLFVAIRVLGDSAITSASGFGVPGRFLFRFWGAAAVGAVEEVGVEDCCCIIWVCSSSLVPKKGADEEGAAIVNNLFMQLQLFALSL